MINDESFERGDRYQFVISYELLMLLEWLIDHEHESLRALIKRAVDQGFPGHGVRHMRGNPEDLQQNIVEFFDLLDSMLGQVVSEDEAENALQRSLVPAINNIDSTMYDSGAFMTSVAKATAAAGRAKGVSAKEVLCKELLKRWKPHKKANMN
jgi:hypothetical protein